MPPKEGRCGDSAWPGRSPGRCHLWESKDAYGPELKGGAAATKPKSGLTASRLFFVIVGGGAGLDGDRLRGLADALLVRRVGKGEAMTLTSTPYKLARLPNDLDSMKSPEAPWRRAVNRLKAKAVW